MPFADFAEVLLSPKACLPFAILPDSRATAVCPLPHVRILPVAPGQHWAPCMAAIESVSPGIKLGKYILNSVLDKGWDGGQSKLRVASFPAATRREIRVK